MYNNLIKKLNELLNDNQEQNCLLESFYRYINNDEKDELAKKLYNDYINHYYNDEYKEYIKENNKKPIDNDNFINERFYHFIRFNYYITTIEQITTNNEEIKKITDKLYEDL